MIKPQIKQPVAFPVGSKVDLTLGSKPKKKHGAHS